MYTLKVENARGEQLELTDSSDYDIANISGLTPPAAAISSTQIAGQDGSHFNSSAVGNRNIVIILNIKPPVELNRQRLYKFFSPKKKCRLYFTNLNRDVFIDGYCETFETDLFGMLQQPQISIICTQPYFNNRLRTVRDFETTESGFEFPFSIEAGGIELGEISTIASDVITAGDIETGGIFTFTARTSQILNPTVSNITTNKFMKINFDMQQGDEIVINTQQNEKSIKLLRAGAETNILNYLTSTSEWIMFEAGDNEIAYTADEGAANLSLTVSLCVKYGGV